ncbi:MAG: hypothetical protein DRR16_13685 [Candidatus Parabeggiatoa sp. nov. 3]|nr:MAG: hypothetical protein DRR00_00055 [Gammaproteobacteria bacterium]RKZ65270.1 MAG: hypothetical protein DRQ99_13190 [Gammaproteobacteria bacterium]RKZ84789.1 MAG: hypothetical protein DRR16_13685 [Gammaproteobacteria bacterium]
MSKRINGKVGRICCLFLYGFAIFHSVCPPFFLGTDRRIQTKNALEQVSSFVYDPNGNLISETDANNHTISYEYEALERRTKQSV